MLKNFYSIEETAEKLGISLHDLDMIEDEKLRKFRDGRRIMYKASDVHALMKEREIDSSNPVTPSMNADEDEEVEVEPGSPEDKIFNATVEGLEASGIVVTPKMKEVYLCFFMMGYNSGMAISKTKDIKIENMVKEILAQINKVAFSEMMK